MMVTLEVSVVCAVVWVVVWAAAWVKVAAVVVIVLDGVMLCRVDANLLCDGRLIVGEMGLCLICWSSGSMICSSSSSSLTGPGMRGRLGLVGKVLVGSIGVGSASAIELRSRVCWLVHISKLKSWMDGSGSARMVVLSCRLISM